MCMSVWNSMGATMGFSTSKNSMRLRMPVRLYVRIRGPMDSAIIVCWYYYGCCLPGSL